MEGDGGLEVLEKEKEEGRGRQLDRGRRERKMEEEEESRVSRDHSWEQSSVVVDLYNLVMQLVNIITELCILHTGCLGQEIYQYKSCCH